MAITTHIIHRHFRRSAMGFSLVETALATVLVGGLFVVAMNMTGASRITQARYAERDQALLLADDLLHEILAKPYEDESGSVVFGIEVGEDLSLRASLDDADDYHGFSESPPTDLQGNAIAGAEGYTRSVQVHWVDLNDPKTVSATETGLKRVVVSMSKGSRATVSLRGYATADWPRSSEMKEAKP